MQVIPRWADNYVQGENRIAVEKHVEDAFRNDRFMDLFKEKIAGPVAVLCSCEVPTSTVYAVASDSDERKIATLKIALLGGKRMHTEFKALV